MTARQRPASIEPNHATLMLVGWFVGVVLLERLLGVVFPTTWEWDALTRGQIAEEIATRGLRWYFVERGETIWLPGYMLLQSTLFRLFGGNPIVLAEWVSAIATGMTAVYLVLLGRAAGLPMTIAMRSPIVLLTSGYALGYGSQAMTEAPSILCLVAGVYHLNRSLHRTGLSHLAVAAMALLLHASMRWEGFLYAVLVPAAYLWLQWRSAVSWGSRTWRRLAFAVAPTVVWFVVWSAYTRWARGAAFQAILHVRKSVHELDRDYIGDPLLATALVFSGLVATSGSLWLVHLGSWRRWWRPSIPEPLAHAPRLLDVAALLAVLHVAWVFGFSLLGILAGWPRHFLYVLPWTALLVAAWTSDAARTRRHVWFSAGCGVLMLAVLRTQHRTLLLLGAEYVRGSADAITRIPE